MLRGRSARVDVGATGVALTAVAGEWLAHTVGYLRLWGAPRAFGSVHAYMGPVGFVLAVAGLAGVQSTVRLGRRLERRLAELRHAPAPSLGQARPPRPSESSRSWSVPVLAVLVLATQCGLYLLQENLETSLAGRHLPGLSPLYAGHGAALVIHLAVAVGLVGGLWLTRREVSRLAQEVRRAEARRPEGRRSEPALLSRRSARRWTPIDRWGMQLWSRPPPAPRVAC